MAPLASADALAVQPTDGLWAHLTGTLLVEYLRNTVPLAVGVGVATIVVGTGCAWLVVMCDFPGRRWLDWALVLPLAMPAYVLAWAHIDFLQYTSRCRRCSAA